MKAIVPKSYWGAFLNLQVAMHTSQSYHSTAGNTLLSVRRDAFKKKPDSVCGIDKWNANCGMLSF